MAVTHWLERKIAWAANPTMVVLGEIAKFKEES
jgi:hypothetical protein